MAQILIVDDDPAFGEGLAETVSDLRHRPTRVTTVRQALHTLQSAPLSEQPSLIFLDLKLPDGNGLEILRSIRSRSDNRRMPVVVLTAYANSDNTIEAMKLGAFDHLRKPLGKEAIASVLHRALDRPLVPVENHGTPTSSGRLLGASEGMRQVQKLIGMTASSDATVMIIGETGTGKEEVARALHQYSARSKQPFVAVNCAAIPEALLESELFGHAKGAFTGAIGSRSGKFQDADKGTLFLDEIGDMPLSTQVKILRALESKTVIPVGGGETRQLDLRVIAATHRDLVSAVREGTFREDLYYRLNVVTICLPPLRDRGSDILVLAEYFLRQSHATLTKNLTPDAAAALLDHRWPGNVRELKNLMQRVSVVVPHSVISREDLGLNPTSRGPLSLDHLVQLGFHPAIAWLERTLLQQAIERSNGNRTQAAELLGMRRQLFYAKLKEHELCADKVGASHNAPNLAQVQNNSQSQSAP